MSVAATTPVPERDERELRLDRICPGCGNPKSRGALRCWTCSVAERTADRDPASGRMRRTLPADAYVCAAGGPRCSGRKSAATAKSCWPCYIDAGGHRGRKHRKGEHTLQNITVDELDRAHALYDAGKSMRAVAAIVHPNTTYATVASCATALYEAFSRRGWPLRDRASATAAANRSRAWQLECDHVIATGKRKGELCGRRAQGDDGKCWHHKPERIAAGIARLRALDEARSAAA